MEMRARAKRPRRDKAWEHGLKADKRGRWAVENVLMVREMLEGGWHALVSWIGPFEDYWVRFSELSKRRPGGMRRRCVGKGTKWVRPNGGGNGYTGCREARQTGASGGFQEKHAD